MVRLDGVAAELMAKRGQQALAERVVLSRSESREERCGQYRRGDGAVDRLVSRPPSFT
jgi:hypothetical protein